MKNRIIWFLPVLTLVMLLAGACQQTKVVYEGPAYINFADTLNYVPVVDEDKYFEVSISSARAVDYDRTVAVEIVDSLSTAIEDIHYVLESNTIVIPAGERVANVKVKGVFENVKPSDDLSFTLHLITDKSYQWNLYEQDTKVVLRKFCPFDINAFVGPCLVASRYMRDYFPPLSKIMRLTYSELVKGKENTIVIRDYFYDGYDFEITLDLEDKYYPRIHFDEQIFGLTSEAFSTIYGDNKIRISEAPGADAFFSNCENFLIHGMLLKVQNDGSDKNHDAFFQQTQGIVGGYMNMIEWISDAEAKKYKELGY